MSSEILQKLCTLNLENYENYLTENAEFTASLREILKSIYDCMILDEKAFDHLELKASLAELFIAGFDSEQIWEEIEIHNTEALKPLKKLIKSIGKAIEEQESAREELREEPSDEFSDEFSDEEASEDASNEEMSGEEVVFSDFEEEGNEEAKEAVEASEEGDFFSMEDLEKFADGQVEEDDEYDIMKSTGEDASNIDYEAFYGSKTEELSAFEKKKLAMKSEIEAMEAENMKEKEWDLIGEATASQRPEGSLLDKYLEFDVADKVQEPMTEEANDKLEEMIRRRIRDEAWDDVERKADTGELERKTVENTEDTLGVKSRVGLAEVYEKEYVKKVTGVDEDDVKLKAQYEEINGLLGELYYQLDVLTNFHYVPSMNVKELEVKKVKNTPAMEMEEKIPLMVSSSQVKAPEEIYAKKKRGIVGESELEKTERKQQRRRYKEQNRKK